MAAYSLTPAPPSTPAGFKTPQQRATSPIMVMQLHLALSGARPITLPTSRSSIRGSPLLGAAPRLGLGAAPRGLCRRDPLRSATSVRVFAVAKVGGGEGLLVVESRAAARYGCPGGWLQEERVLHARPQASSDSYKEEGRKYLRSVFDPDRWEGERSGRRRAGRGGARC